MARIYLLVRHLFLSPCRSVNGENLVKLCTHAQVAGAILRQR